MPHGDSVDSPALRLATDGLKITINVSVDPPHPTTLRPTTPRPFTDQRTS